MSDESTLNQGGSEALPEAPVKAPKSDAEAAIQQGSNPPEDAAKRAEREEGERKKNRTKEYIDRQNRRIAELSERLARHESQGSTPSSAQGETGDKEPTLEDFDWDIAAFNKAHAKWSVNTALKEQTESAKRAEEGRKQQEIVSTYQERVATFTEDHPDFQVAVGSIPYQLSPEVQAAIMAHERGPEIAYHLANNDDDAFNLSNAQPHVAAAAVERLAKRVTAAPQTPTHEQASAPLAQQTPTKPITKAPAPTATLSGRTPTETPSEKLTDDEWYRRDQERRRKR